ncbi:MAG: C39 family peptidase, partial [candidate division Zixibacteria bacterium]|nr:C39 family peptidase [candidate division Zixibacteria bacterium]
MKKISFAVLFVTLLWAGAMAQQSTTGPEPPPGLDPGLQLDKKAQTVISGVPTYLWQHGCGPTALGMLIGYYDSHGYPTLVPGDATSQNSAVNAMIADDSNNPVCGSPASDHYQDYACPIDYSPNMQTDRSETGGTHTDNCVADFMSTSRSAFGNYYGWSWFSDMDNAFRDYVNDIDPSLTPYADNYYFSQFSWEDYKAEIDNNRPVVLLVDTDGDGSTDHFITAVGYDDATMTYGLYNTWDHSLHWYVWRPMNPGSSWGVFGATVISLGQLS